MTHICADCMMTQSKERDDKGRISEQQQASGTLSTLRRCRKMLGCSSVCLAYIASHSLS